MEISSDLTNVENISFKSRY